MICLMCRTLSDWNGTQTHNRLVRKRTNHLVESLKLQISRFIRGMSSLTFRQL